MKYIYIYIGEGWWISENLFFFVVFCFPPLSFRKLARFKFDFNPKSFALAFSFISKRSLKLMEKKGRGEEFNREINYLCLNERTLFLSKFGIEIFRSKNFLDFTGNF